MKGKYSLALAAGLLLCGCGGSGGLRKSVDTGFYRGTLEITSDGWINGSAPMFLDVVDIATYHGEAMSDEFYVYVDGQDGFSNVGGVSGTGAFTKTASGVRFEFNNGSSVTATGVLEPAALPSLGPTVAIPSAGSFEGEFLVLSNGHAKTMGRVTATVDSIGGIVAILDGGIGYVHNGIFSGNFEEGGTLADAAYHAGGIITQDTPPAYSFHAGVLTIRFDSLILGPASCWLTLTPVE